MFYLRYNKLVHLSWVATSSLVLQLFNAFPTVLNAFSKYYNEKDYYSFDRTPFYVKMASLEKELKQAAGITTKIKMTVADMLIL